MSTSPSTTISVRGCTIGLIRMGQGRPLLVLHGASGPGIFGSCLPELAQRHDVLLPEHPGFGSSETPDWLDNAADLANFYLDFLDELDLRGIDLVGFSLGGWIAAELAVRNTSRIGSLTLVSSAGINVPGVQRIDTFLMNDEQRVRALFHDEKRAEEMIQRLLRPENEDTNMKNQTTTARIVWQPRDYDPHLHKWLHRIRLPSHIIWGANDRLFPQEYAQAWQKLIPGSRLTIIPECGHVPPIEQPELFLAALEGFLEGRRTAA
jgi:pimeloyl-ACP methyl ester carboxylesterase